MEKISIKAFLTDKDLKGFPKSVQDQDAVPKTIISIRQMFKRVPKKAFLTDKDLKEFPKKHS
jgi:hypothetical protein